MSWARFCVRVFLMAGCVHARLLILRVFCTDAPLGMVKSLVQGNKLKLTLKKGTLP